MLGTSHDEIAMLPDEVGLFLAGLPAASPCPLLRLARSSPPSLASASLGQLASESSQGIEHADVDVFEDMKDTQLMAGIGPEFGQQFRVEVRAIGDDDVR